MQKHIGAITWEGIAGQTHRCEFFRSSSKSLLWIDSLCIFQDSEQDWAQEAASIADVYQNCVLTITVLGANESDHGCFGHRDPLLYRPCWLFADEEGHDEYVHPHIGDDDMSSSSSNKALSMKEYRWFRSVCSPQEL
jgi:hypothetical protein